jgi:CRP/FNR family transcriptional regulator
MSRTFICPKTGCPLKSFFSCLSSPETGALGRVRLGRRYEKGENVFKSDTLALAIYCVHAGSVGLTRATRQGESIMVGVRGAGEILGFREAFADVPHQVSAEALEASMICEMPREDFLAVVRGSPELARRLMKRMALESIAVETQLAVRAHLDVIARVAVLLSAQASKRAVQDAPGCQAVVRMGREEMALLVGTARETLSRALAKLAARGIVRLEKGAVHVLDLEALQDLASR